MPKIKLQVLTDKRETRKTLKSARQLLRVPGVHFGSPNGMIVDSEVSLVMCPEIPVGGRLTKFLQNWEQITTDKWVLSIIKEGYKLEFNQKPSWTGIKKTIIFQENLDIFMEEINTLLEKDVIEKVHNPQTLGGFYSTLFLVPKKNGKLKMVTNLKPLNGYLKKIHFKMDTMQKVINLVKLKDWAISLDLSDAYFHLPIFPNHRKYMRFYVQNQSYQWKAMCFGPTCAPRVFTKVVSVVAAYLRTQNIRLVIYLDDWLIVNQDKNQLLQDRQKCLNLIVSLGFIINKEKSNLIPSQEITYLGGVFHLDKGLVFPTRERTQNLHMLIQNMFQGQSTALDFLKILGTMASCIELIPNARLYMRPIQLHLLSFWNPMCRDMNIKIPFTQHLKSHLLWWKNSANTQKGRFLVCPNTTATITTDASKSGFGGYISQNQIFQGEWTATQKTWHINCLEMKAVILTLKHFLNQLKNNWVLVRCDNTSVVQYINRQGGTKSPNLCYLTWELWKIAIQNNIVLKAAHIMGKKNILADQLSRVRIRPTEWTLNNTVVNQIFVQWGNPLIDLFGSWENRPTEIFCTWIPHPNAFAVDALTISWENMYAYIFPPICLIPKILKYMRQFRCQIILIAPQWPRKVWYPEILELLVALSIRIPMLENLLSKRKTKIYHPNPQMLSLNAWLFSTGISKQRAFQCQIEPCSMHLDARNAERLFCLIGKVL